MAALDSLKDNLLNHLGVHQLAENHVDKDVLVVGKKEVFGQLLISKHVAYKLENSISIAPW